MFLNSFCTLFAFTPILMDLGTKIAPPAWPSFAWLHAFGHGWMFASAALAAAVGLGVAMLAGSKLVGLEVHTFPDLSPHLPTSPHISPHLPNVSPAAS